MNLQRQLLSIVPFVEVNNYREIGKMMMKNSLQYIYSIQYDRNFGKEEFMMNNTYEAPKAEEQTSRVHAQCSF